MVWFGKPKVAIRVQGYSFLCFLCVFSFLFLPLMFKFCVNGRHVMVEDTCATPSLFTISKVGTTFLVDPYKVIVRRSAFSAFPNAQNEDE